MLNLHYLFSSKILDIFQKEILGRITATVAIHFHSMEKKDAVKGAVSPSHSA